MPKAIAKTAVIERRSCRKMLKRARASVVVMRDAIGFVMGALYYDYELYRLRDHSIMKFVSLAVSEMLTLAFASLVLLSELLIIVYVKFH